MIISIHIPKTGGTTFAVYLRRIYEQRLYTDHGLPADTPNYSPYPINELPNEINKSTKIIHGHIRSDKYDMFYPDADFITWLRHPVERVLSHYFYSLHMLETSRIEVSEEYGANLPLEVFIENPEHQNIMSKFIHDKNIENFKFIGITEDYDESLKIFRKVFDLKTSPLRYEITNKTPNKKQPLKEIRKKIEILNEKDMILYEKAIQKYKEQKKLFKS